MLEIEAPDQKAYEGGIIALRQLAVPDPRGKADAERIYQALQGGVRVDEILGISEASIRRATSENKGDRLTTRKPLKAGVFALSRYTHERIWRLITTNHAGDLDSSMASNITEANQASENPFRRVGVVIDAFRTEIINYFHHYMASEADLKPYLERLDRLIKLSQSAVDQSLAQDIEQQIEVAINNAVGSITNIVYIIPATFLKQFGREITQEEFEEIMKNIVELAALEAMLHLEGLKEVTEISWATRRNQKIVLEPAYHVIGKNPRGGLSMAIKPDRLAQIKPQKHQGAHLGCSMRTIITEFHNLLTGYAKRAFLIDTDARIDEYHLTLNRFMGK